jgi:hypothetical protein
MRVTAVSGIGFIAHLQLAGGSGGAYNELAELFLNGRIPRRRPSVHVGRRLLF